jgi:hypothetical protein
MPRQRCRLALEDWRVIASAISAGRRSKPLANPRAAVCGGSPITPARAAGESEIAFAGYGKPCNPQFSASNDRGTTAAGDADEGSNVSGLTYRAR